MKPALGVALFWLAFAGSHVGLSTRRIRARLVERLGAAGFFALFSAVAAVTFAALVRFYALHRFAGAAGPALGVAHEGVRALLSGLAFAGIALSLASLGAYPASPYALGSANVREPRGLERVSRHPFFAGMALFGAAHALLATRLAGAVFFGALAVYAVAGAAHQDRRFLAERGEAHARWLAATSFVPFAAIAAGRQRLVWRELPWGALGASLLAAWALRLAHGSLLAANGAWLVAAVLGGAALATFGSLRRAARRRAARPQSTQNARPTRNAPASS